MHTLCKDDEQVFFAKNFQTKINSSIITTENELVKEQISDFSKQLNLDELFSYAEEVKKSTEEYLSQLKFCDLKKKIPEERKEKKIDLKVVSTNENAIWLVDYWCSKNVASLIKMPFSRHWIMHTEAILRIKEGLQKYK